MGALTHKNGGKSGESTPKKGAVAAADDKGGALDEATPDKTPRPIPP